jgi:hypothetical protein
MPIILPLDLTSEEIRVLQEFRRLTTDTLPLETIKAIKHPTGASGEKPAVTLVAKSFLTADGEVFSLTQKSKDFLAIDAKPMFEEASPAAAPASTDTHVEGA